mmetsp:Transcript_25947/g.42579  ORF Transcript_25947/g.42579 Transcript_25947/m.42579 type:complete len:84 (-) Transcript_25947:264-515(-)
MSVKDVPLSIGCFLKRRSREQPPSNVTKSVKSNIQTFHYNLRPALVGIVFGFPIYFLVGERLEGDMSIKLGRNEEIVSSLFFF